MLVLSRKQNESIIINDNITITVLGIKRNRVRLGIDAPRKIPIHRMEVFNSIQQEQENRTPPPREVISTRSESDKQALDLFINDLEHHPNKAARIIQRFGY